MNIKRVILPVIFIAIILLFPLSCQKKAQIKDESFSGNIAVLVAEGFHDAEAYIPIGFFTNQGYKITVIGSAIGTVKAYNSDFTINIEKSVKDVGPENFDALILPGGRGPALLREDSNVVEFVKAFWGTGKVTAAICHGPQVLVTAGVLSGRTSTGTGSIKDEIEQAGGTFVDQTVVVDRNIVTSRNPQDLFNFSSAIFEALKK